MQGHWSSHSPSPAHTHTSLFTCISRPQLLLSSGKSVWPPPPARTLGLQRSLWEDVNSVPSLPQKTVSQDLLDPWSSAWSTGSVREAEGKLCRAGAETSPRTEVGSPEHRRQSSPLGCWGGDEVGQVRSIYSVVISPWHFCAYPRGRFGEGFFFLIVIKHT